nr:ABC transporter ATP-binding protein [uncultured Lichenicoccus sp.]
MTPMLQMRGIVRRFGAVTALDAVDLDVCAGQIVGLLGENGSGKSTLMRILFGMLRPDAGGIVFKGGELSGHTPAQAMRAGLGMIHQHFTLVEAMTVLENVMLGWPRAGRVLRRREISRMIVETGARYGLEVDPGARVRDLPLGRRQRVEILKAILRGADLLILDEPTSNLAPAEVDGLLGVLRRLRQDGTGIVLISHKLPEVLAVCDDVVVLRAGRVVARLPVAAATRQSLAAAMLGPGMAGAAVKAGRGTVGAVRLSVRDLRGGPPGGMVLGGVSFEIRAGEVLGVAGVDGNGQIELVDSLAGLQRPAAGRITLDGRDITFASVTARLRAGLAYSPADRAQTGLVRGMSIADNLALRQDRRTPRRRGLLARQAERLIREYDIRAPGPQAVAATLSGGNQQKIVLAREIERAPGILIAHQPTWGLDPGAAGFVLQQVARLRSAGAAILYVASDLEEVLSVSDHVAVLFEGRIAGIAPRAEARMDQLGLWMAGGSA